MKQLALLCICFLFFTACEKEKEIQQKPLHVTPIKNETPLQVKIQNIQDELSKIHTVEYLEDYITKAIDEGLDGSLGYPAGAMDKGYAYKSDSPNIARFVVTLSGKKSSDDALAKKSELFYTSNCGGCHGHDGKGLDGAFPNLTLQTLQGIKKREETLQTQLHTLQNSK